LLHQCRKLRDRLRSFSDEALDEIDYEEAATCFTRCRAKGLQGSNTDFLICAVSMRRRLAILTTDNDFAGFARVLGFELHAGR
jgi:predicted nucleic acid-binding protein